MGKNIGRELRERVQLLLDAEISDVKVRDNNWLIDYTEEILTTVGLSPDQEA